MQITTEHLVDAALRYAELGYPVFPCVPGGKVPITPHGFQGRHHRRRADRGMVGRSIPTRTSACRRLASSSSTWTARTTPGPATPWRRTSRLVRSPLPRAAAGTTSSGSRTGKSLEEHGGADRTEGRHPGRRRLHRRAALGRGREAVPVGGDVRAGRRAGAAAGAARLAGGPARWPGRPVRAGE